MLPYFEQPIWHVGPLSVHAFGVAVGAAVWLGLTRAQQRFAHDGLDPALGQRLGVWVLVGGILGAHLFSVLLYFPHKLRADPWLILRLWEDVSSLGGMLGGIGAALLFFATRVRQEERAARLAFLDAIAFVFPASLAIGRFGCALAHDHPGRVTTFPLAISLDSRAALDHMDGVYRAAGLTLPPAAPTMGFHDLGLYEFLFLALVIVPLFAFWNRRRRPAGFYLVAFSALYFPVRFCLDMLRVGDTRYAGLTPAQWVAALVIVALPVMAARYRRLRPVVWACTSGRL
jgi:phosphatidylglycerol:prolipoprotein diacylglycerol transferase